MPVISADIAEVARADEVGLRGVLVPGRPPLGLYAEPRFARFGHRL